ADDLLKLVKLSLTELTGLLCASSATDDVVEGAMCPCRAPPPPPPRVPARAPGGGEGDVADSEAATPMAPVGVVAEDGAEELGGAVALPVLRAYLSRS